jgi:5-methylcytosine-specific restriction protein A
MPKRIKTHDPRRIKTKDQRPSASQRGYGARWQRYRAWFLAQNCACRECGRAATVVDHIRPHRGDYDLFWDELNHQPLCKRCHDQKTAREDGGFGRST